MDPTEWKGIYRKFEVRRTDGSSEPGGKHEGCAYYVLDLEHDPFALPALEAYAAACEATLPDLARDIRHLLDAQRAGSTPNNMMRALLVISDSKAGAS